MPQIKSRKDLPDTQASVEGFPKKAIKKVGTRNVELPIAIKRQDNTTNFATANISLYTDLNDRVKGANMSRYRILLEELIINKHLLLDQFIRELLKETKTRLGATQSYAKIRFDYFLIKEAPVSKMKSHLNCKCILEGEHKESWTPNTDKLYLTVSVPYSSLCPCSKAISDYGAHNQPSLADVKVELIPGQMCWIEELVDLVESVASAPIRNILKREDEAYMTELMYERPFFVEDMIRNISVKLDEKLDKNIADYSCVVNHFESIHQQFAVAVATADRNLT